VPLFSPEGLDRTAAVIPGNNNNNSNNNNNNKEQKKFDKMGTLSIHL